MKINKNGRFNNNHSFVFPLLFSLFQRSILYALHSAGYILPYPSCATQTIIQSRIFSNQIIIFPNILVYLDRLMSIQNMEYFW